MSVVRVEHVDGTRVIHVEGCATDDDLREALSSLRDHAGPTILDLAELTLVGPGVAELVAGLVDTCGAVCVTARRHTARVILHRSGIADLCVMFSSVGDALQALRLAEAGYGAGWSEHLEAAR